MCIMDSTVSQGKLSKLNFGLVSKYIPTRDNLVSQNELAKMV